MKRTWLLGIATAVVLTASASAAYAQSNGNGNGNGNGQGGNGQGNNNLISTLAATPELDSIVMLGSALLGGAGYIALKRRTARR